MGRIATLLSLVLLLSGCADAGRDGDRVRPVDGEGPTTRPTKDPGGGGAPGRTSRTAMAAVEIVDAAKSIADQVPTTKPGVEPKRIDYKSGVVIDFKQLQVELRSQVVLRHGDLELLAWSKSQVPKGHETVLMVDARPSDVYEALGLIGLTPGTPPRFDVDAKQAIAATGDRVDVFVRYKKDGRDVEHSICEWAIDKSREAPLAKRSWVFCGSHHTEQGALAADIEGTLVTVVDFPSSLLSLSESHSESNAELWLVAHTKAIPEQGTPVTLVLRAADGS